MEWNGIKKNVAAAADDDSGDEKKKKRNGAKCDRSEEWPRVKKGRRRGHHRRTTTTKWKKCERNKIIREFIPSLCVCAETLNVHRCICPFAHYIFHTYTPNVTSEFFTVYAAAAVRVFFSFFILRSPPSVILHARMLYVRCTVSTFYKNRT